MPSWATPADVQALTGKVVDDAAVDMAQSVVELTSGGRIASMDTVLLSRRNLDWLRRAVAYQTAFMVEFPDYFVRMEVTSMSQDGVNAVLKADSLVIAPLARRCMKRLSWRGMRTITPSINRTNDRAGYRTSNAPDIPGIPSGSATSSAFDDDLPWQPLG